jgi:HAE1 family hydrophobic/amphiphilic exporter-1
MPAEPAEGKRQMGFSHFFIERPIFATVVSILITLIGGVAYFALPVAQYPDIAPPTVEIRATYPGASAETVSDTVATPLEQEINGVDNMLYVVSQATADGNLSIQVVFALGTDLDTAQVLVQNRVAIAEPRLPEEVRRLGVTVRKNSPDMLMVIHLVSPDGSRDQLYMSNYATLQVRDVLSRLDGVGDVRIFGARDYSMRIWLDPEKVASRGLTAGEVVAALRAQNVQVASGVLNQPPVRQPGAFQLNVETQGRLNDPRQFANIIVKTDPDGRVTRVRWPRRTTPPTAISTSARPCRSSSSSALARMRSKRRSGSRRRWRSCRVPSRPDSPTTSSTIRPSSSLSRWTPSSIRSSRQWSWSSSS